eukprot:CAMPEP_0115527480 /NCGR_PEP_ID=MMETSP0271-20121206/82869_1 /TAXON_ID=71861 /ORGANISM="Scrippsiella trochoidea, Strain CCMP3099" /LENGTH=63 /DNA_ID=CAMNT_0002959315 /DNA_START=67 /DNA_END=255 /DNA_ORIENTATION=-
MTADETVPAVESGFAWSGGISAAAAAAGTNRCCGDEGADVSDDQATVRGEAATPPTTADDEVA